MKRLYKLYDVGAVLSFAVTAGCVLLEVVSRNIVHLPTTWAEEMSRIFCVWTVFLGAAAVWFRGGHIVVNVLPYRLTGRPKLVLALLAHLLTAVFLACLWFGGLWMLFISAPSRTAALEISLGYLYLALVVGATGMVIFHLNQMATTFKELKNFAAGAPR